MVCGYGEQVAYSELVQSLPCRIDKSSRFTDWQRRPLGAAQIAYAIGDVTHLRDIYKSLSKRVALRASILARRRNENIDLACDLRAASRARLGAVQEQGPQAARSRDADGACAWRETEAQTRDVPRARVLKDDALIELALAAPRTANARNLRAFPRGMDRSRAAAEILAAVERGLSATPRHCRSSTATGATASRRDGRTAQGAAAASERGQRRRGA